MSILLRKFYEETQDTFELQLLAGAEGLDNDISWIYLYEDMDNMDFLRGGELTITTGMMSKNDPNWLSNLIKALTKTHSAGLIINVGKYIKPEAITQDLIDLCNERHFPLLTMPWHIFLRDIVEDCSNRILLAKQTEHTLHHIITNAIVDPTKERSFVDELAAQGYHFTSLTIAILEMDTPELTAKDYDLLYSVIKSVFNRLDLNPILCRYRNQVMLTFLNGETEAKHKYFGEITAEWHRSGHRKPLILGESTALVETLRTYLSNNGNAVLTAQALFTHRNTVSYRLEKIKSILGEDLSSSQTIFNLTLAFYIDDYLNIVK